MTDLKCCARGLHRNYPSIRTVIDIQAQTSRVVRLGESGLVNSSVVSEKCAAGSGRLLDVVARVLQVEIDEIGSLSMKSKNPVSFSTGCAVSGESEAILRVAEGTAKQNTLAAVHRSIADRISSLVARVGMAELCGVVGGGALNAGLVSSIEEKLAVKAVVPPHPKLIAALGTAVMAEEKGQIVTA